VHNLRNTSERKLYARTYPGEYAKIIKENFGIAYEPGLIDTFIPCVNIPKISAIFLGYASG